MEPVGAFFDEEFDFLKMFTNVNDDFLLSNPADDNNFSQNFVISPQAFLHEATNSNTMAHNFYLQSFDSHNIESFVSQESSNSSGSEIQGYFENGSHEGNNVDSFLTLPNDSIMHFLAMDTQNVGDNTNDHQVVPTLASGSLDQLKRKLDAANLKSYNDSSSTQLEAPNNKKKPRAPRNTQKNKKSNKGQTKKKKKIVEDNNINETNEDKESSENAGKQIQAPTCSLSEDDSNALEEANGEVTTSECKDSSVPNSKGKTRAARGNATDPQSLYARKRRERINERLRVLQNLVPNGTKVDISTMLEEAVQYVKFLQLQIQLLSSDDMWMFAPLAFNGIDVGVYQGMFPHL